MLYQDLLDAVVIVLMFVLRIGVPLVVTLAFGYWLEKKLRPEETIDVKPAPIVRSGKANNIIHLHCWDVKRCDQARRAECAAYKHPDLPCWLALQVEGDKVNEECFTCALYKPQSIAA